MGLDISTGFLAQLEPEEVGDLREDIFAHVNRVLAAEGLPLHAEPLEVANAVSYQMYGYSGLHYCRRAAAHLWKFGRVDSPGNSESSSDPILSEYCKSASTEPGELGDVTRIWTPGPAERTFHHLVHHQDHEGLYLPIPFEKVLAVYDPEEAEYDFIGSTHRLQRECEVLATELNIPLGLDPESEEVWDASEDDSKWRGFGIEGFGLLRLINACRLANEHSTALVFH